MCSSVCMSQLSGDFLLFCLLWWRFDYSTPHVPWVNVTSVPQWITPCLPPVHHTHYDVLSISTETLLVSVAFIVPPHSDIHTHRQIDKHALIFLCVDGNMSLVFFVISSCLLLAFFHSPSLSPSVCLSPVCPCWQVCTPDCVFVCVEK